jgi:hypothetical protein
MVTRVLFSLIPLSIVLGISFFIEEWRYTSLIFERENELQAFTHFTNALHAWQLDPLMTPIADLLGWSDPSMGILGKNAVLSLSYFFILVSGLGALLLQEDKHDLRVAAAKALPLIAILIIFGLSTVTYASLCWIPWIFVALRLFQSLYWRLFLASIVTLLAGAAAGTLGLLFLPPLLLFFGSTHSFTPRIILASLSILGCLMFSIDTGSLHEPQYPNDAHLVADDGIPGHVHPLTSSAPAIPFIDRNLEKTTLRPLMVIMLCSLLLLYPLARNKRTHLAFIGIALILVLDTAVAEELSLIAPVQTLRRIIPGGFWIAPASTLLAITLVLIAIFSRSIIAATTSLALIIWASFFGPTYETRVAGTLLTAEDHELIQLVSPQNQKPIQNLILSPSFSLIKNYHITPEKLSSLMRDEAFQEADIQLPELNIVVSEGSLFDKKNLFDQNPQTRSRIGESGQKGVEYICIELIDQGRFISQVFLSLGGFPTDFPRGLRIFEGARCETLPSDSAQIQEFIPWEGPIRTTTEGYLYYGKQSEVTFQTKGQTQAVLIQQTEKSFFDWSIAELKVSTRMHE